MQALQHAVTGACAALGLVALVATRTFAETRLVEVAPRESLRVADHGAGTPVVLVPGAMGSAFAFRRVAPLLVGSGHRALVVEPLGLGGSSRPESADYSLTAQADRLGALLDTLRIESAVFVGQALGASIALRVACRRPERVLAVVSLDGGPAEATATPSLRLALKLAPLVKLFGGVKRLRGRVRESLVANSADPRWVTPEAVEGYLGPAAQDLDGTLRTYRLIARAREPERLSERLGEVRCPVLLLVGAVPHDTGIRSHEVGLLAARLPRFERTSVAGTGHFIAEEAPEAVVEAVARALAQARPEGLARVLGGSDAPLR